MAVSQKDQQILDSLNQQKAARHPEPQAQQGNQAPKAPLHNANLALQGMATRQAETDAINDAKAYAGAYSQAYTMEVLRQKAEFLQSFHSQSSHSQAVARTAISQNNQEDFFAAANELEGMIAAINNYQPPQIAAPQYNLLPPSLA